MEIYCQKKDHLGAVHRYGQSLGKTICDRYEYGLYDHVLGKKSVQLPVKQELLSIWDELKNIRLEAYVDKVVNKFLMEEKPAGGKIVSTNSKPFGYIEWTLSNGLKVRFKDTDYEEDDIFFYGYSPGGYSLVNDEDLPSAQFAANNLNSGVGDLNALELGKILIGKDAYVNLFVKENYDELSGVSSTIKDVKTLFQLIYLKMTKLRKDRLVFENAMQSAMIWKEKRLAEPGIVLQDTLKAMRSNYHPRKKLFLEYLEKIDYDKGFRIMQERFADASDFTFFITGNIDVDSVKPLVETYLGGLPSTYTKEKMIDHKIHPPKGMIKNHFTHPMETPKSIIDIMYTGRTIPDTEETRIQLIFLKSILNTIYREKIREQMGAAYSVSVQYAISPFPTADYYCGVRLVIDSDPVKREELIGIVYDEIKQIKKHGPSLESVEKVRKYLLKKHKEIISEKNANYWSQGAETLFVYGVDLYTNYEVFVNSVTPKMIRKFARKVFKNNIMEVSMNPEK
jgi:zinc protease